MSDADELSVPVELATLLHRRLCTLTPATQDVLLAAAALASPRGLADAVDPHAGSAIAAAVAADVIEDGIGDVRFSHPLLSSVCYAAASPAQRRAIHERLAGVVDDPVEQAHHLGLAADGPDAGVARTVAEASLLAAATVPLPPPPTLPSWP